MRAVLSWLRQRDVRYLASRVASLTTRYGITTARGKRHALDCVSLLAAHGCRPTFCTPGRVVKNEPQFFRQLHDMGVEVAVHGYDHVDFRSLSSAQVERQFRLAAESFSRSGIPFEGFRCPYLSYSDEVLNVSAAGMFSYSSNSAIAWNVVPSDPANRVFSQLASFYRAASSEEAFARPRMSRHLVEIPVSLPDDLQLHDGLELGDEGVAGAWAEILGQTHRRGDLFAPLFHPESLERSALALETVLGEASELRPHVWVTQLRDVARWWREKASFRADVSTTNGSLRVQFHCSERATVLARSVETPGATRRWTDGYDVVESRVIDVPADRRPFVGVAGDADPAVACFLGEQGYVTDTSSAAMGCSIFLDAERLARFANEVELIEHIEASGAPLVRFWVWPDDARSAVAIAGDLDALSLRDHAARIFTL
jgi:hypothetical protein